MNPLMNRRRFLVVTAASVTGYAAWLHVSRVAGQGLYTVCYADKNTYAERGDGFGMISFDIDRGTSRQFSTPINVHDIAVHPDRPYYAVGANKYGSNFGEFDLKSGEVLKVHELSAEFKLLGHMAYSDDGRFLCATGVKSSFEKSGQNFKNVLFMLNTKTFEIEGTIRIPDCSPSQHDCRFLPESHVAVATGGREVAYVDVAEKKVETEAIDSLSTGSAVRHFSMSKQGQLAMQSNVIVGVDGDAWTYGRGEPIIADRPAKRFEPARTPRTHRADFNREVLDLCFGPTGEVFATVMHGLGRVSFWNFASGELIKEVPILKAHRISLTRDGMYFVVLSRLGLRFISSDTLEHVPSMDSFNDDVTRSISETTYLSHARVT